MFKLILPNAMKISAVARNFSWAPAAARLAVARRAWPVVDGGLLNKTYQHVAASSLICRQQSHRYGNREPFDEDEEEQSYGSRGGGRQYGGGDRYGNNRSGGSYRDGGGYRNNGSGGGGGYRGGGGYGGGGGGYRGGGGYGGGGYGGGGYGGGSYGGNNRQRGFNMAPLPKPDLSKLEPFEKNLYKEHPNITNRSDEDVKSFLKQHSIYVRGEAPKPVQTFEEVNFPDSVLAMLRHKKFGEPTPIQAQGWPIAMSGKNLVCVAQTGSGKTLGYTLPAITHIQSQVPLKRGDGPIALVVAPTRELAQQINTVANEFGAPSVRTACVFGGASRHIQERALQSGVEMLIGCPGRLLDFLQTGATNLQRCTYVVLDEADRMLDMGFEQQIRQILSQIRPDRQILMWSATWPRDIVRLAEDFLDKYVQVNVGSLELRANPNIEQVIKVCQNHEKQKQLQQILSGIYENKNPGKIIIFAERKSDVDKLANHIRGFGVACSAIHGDKSQAQRDSVLNDLRTGRSNILVATDVAARGLDVSGINYVINFDFPKDIESYVHRIGRTGRQNNKGTAISLFTPDNAGIARDLTKLLQDAGQSVEPQLLAFSGRR